MPHGKAESKGVLHDRGLQTSVRPQEPQQLVTALALISFLLAASLKDMKSPYPRTPLQNRDGQDESSSTSQLLGEEKGWVPV